jgi:hypothetical protein
MDLVRMKTNTPDSKNNQKPDNRGDVPVTVEGRTRPNEDAWEAERFSLFVRAFRNRRDGLAWLFAGVVLAGIVGMGAVLLFILSAQPEASLTPTTTSVGVIVASTAQATATFTPLPTATPFPTLTPTVTSTPTSTPDVILLGVESLGELSTVEYSLKTVVEKEAEQPGLISVGGIEIWRPRVHFLLVATGRVKAGVDFRELVRYEIVQDRVTLYLPAPRITDFAIDTESLKLYYIHTSFGLDEKFVVEHYNKALVEAQESLKRAALDSDILTAAQTNAAALLQSLILGLGFSDVEVVFLPARGGEAEFPEEPLKLILTPAAFVTATPGG